MEQLFLLLLLRYNPDMLMRTWPARMMTTTFDIPDPFVAGIIVLARYTRHLGRREGDVAAAIWRAARAHLIVLSAPVKEVRECTSDRGFNREHAHDGGTRLPGQQSEDGFCTSSLEGSCGGDGGGAFSFELPFVFVLLVLTRYYS